jgi:pantoate kinase
LSDNRKRAAINHIGEPLIEKLIIDPDFDNFVTLASQFSKKLNLWSEDLAKLALSIPPEIITSQIMLGNALFLFYKPDTSISTLSHLNSSYREENICQETVVRSENDAN